ncbi:GC-rich sequence DNA-binding factor-like protein-domain-containing protein [Xylogone sp. PMI_703]|nr:GC-rich sequence DNA-binding factor-like protein-domain-containing protein [Xylogone sp. PMI_703]
MSSSMYAFAREGSSSDSSGDENDDFLHPSADPNADEFADYNPRKRRRTGRDAKESAALGIFGSESEDEGPGRRWKQKNLRQKGMSFVPKGHTQSDEDEEEDEEQETTTRDDDEAQDLEMQADEDEEQAYDFRAGLGLGAKGLGFQSPAPSKPISFQKGATPLGRGFVPSSANVPVLKVQEQEISTPRISRPSAFSTPTSTKGRGKGGAPNANSFAARMMAKMGYKEGQGLGKEGQGRSGVIEVQLRPQGVGLGAVAEKTKQEKEEEKRQAKLRGEVYEDSDEERKKQRRKQKTSGTDSGTSTPRRAPKPKFRTVEEMQKAAPGLQIPDAFAPILDMTGPGQRLLTSTSGLLTPTAGMETVEQAENRKLARRAQNDLSAFVEEWKNLEERKAYVEMQIIQERQELEEKQRQFDQMKAFSDTVQGISDAAKNGQWDPVIEALTDAESLDLSSISTELSNIAVAAVYPFLRQAAEGWQPLEEPKLNGIAPALSNIRHVIGATSDNKAVMKSGSEFSHDLHRSRFKSTTPYESMIYKVVFPKVVSAINRDWDVHNPAPLQTLLDVWEGLIPPFVLSQILEQTVITKLDEAVSAWKPRKHHKSDLPHFWLFPWLQYLPAHHADPKSSTGLVSDVKRKFRQLIDHWDFSRGVIPGFERWKDVLRPSSSNDQWTPLIMNHVLPSMARFLRDERHFQVDPNDQSPYMAALQGIFAWQDILKPRVVAQVIVDTVFPMWHNVLYQWLTVVGPNEEIGQWFEWWRDEVFPDIIKDLPSIQKEFEKGHEMIEQALDLGAKVKTDLPAPSLLQHPVPEDSSAAPSAPPTPARQAAPTVEEPLTIRNKLDDWCIENDLQFLPEKKVLHAAGPLFRITAAGNGKNGTLVYFKGDNLYAITKKGADILINWENEDARDALLEMAWYNVK